MRRLRNQVTALFLLVVTAGVAGTALVTTRAFVADKRDYVMELNSVTAPGIASAIGRHLDHLQDQLVVFHDILRSMQKAGGTEALLQSAFQKLSRVSRIEVYDSRGPIASVGPPGNSAEGASLTAESVKALRGQPERRLSSVSGGVIFSTRVDDYVYVAHLSQDFFTEYFEQARALGVMLAGDGGLVLASSDSAPERSIPPAVLSELIGSLQARDRQAVIARELVTSGGMRMLAAAAPIPRTGGATVVVQATAAQVSQMVQQVLRYSLPFVAVILGLATVLGVLFSAEIARPLEELTEATSRIASGHWKVSIPTRSKTEVGRLVRAFSRMGNELERREEALKRANEELVKSERLATLGKFSAGLAHEVKNPLNSILGYSQLINMKKAALDETTVKYLGFIMDETRRASKIISDLLTFARQKPPVLSPARVSEVLDRAFEMLQPQAQAAKVEMTRAIDDGGLQARLDRDQLFQVILNLVQNAFHAMEEKPEGTRSLALRQRRESDWVVIDVADAGAGITKENLDKIFEPFFSTKGVGKGTGLGLSMCLGIVQHHNGKIEVTSEVGKGTTFSVYLPVAVGVG